MYRIARILNLRSKFSAYPISSALCKTKVQSSPTNSFSPHSHFPAQIGNHAGILRRFTADGGDPKAAEDHNKVVDEINLKFAEAREEIEAAMDSKETVYFDEEAECAREAVKEVVGMFEGLLSKMQEKDRLALQRSMGLKIEQLKAEVMQLDD